MPQNDHIELHQKRYGRQMDFETRQRKKEARQVRVRAQKARSLKGLKAKLYNKERFKEKVQMKKTIKMHEESLAPAKESTSDQQKLRPNFLMDRREENWARTMSNSVKQKRNEKAGKWTVPIPKVRAQSEIEVFREIRSGKRQKKSWKRLVTKPCFVGDGFTRKPPKYERFIRPMGLRLTKAHVTSKALGCTFQLPIISVVRNPSSTVCTQLGVLTKGTIIEVNVSELGLVTPGGKIVWGKRAQVSNNPENDGCVNAVLLE